MATSYSQTDIARRAHEIASARCREVHPGYFETHACIGPGSEEGFDGICDECKSYGHGEANREVKMGKAHGRLVPQEEAERMRRLDVAVDEGRITPTEYFQRRRDGTEPPPR